MASKVSELKHNIDVLVTEKYVLTDALYSALCYLTNHPLKSTKYRVVKELRKALRETSFTTIREGQ